jgi:hypothetical protein
VAGHWRLSRQHGDEPPGPRTELSSKLENVPLYQHFGFHVTSTLGLPEGAPVVTTMWRPGGLRDDASPERA